MILMIGAMSNNIYFSTIEAILSGPTPLCGFKFHNNLAIPGSVMFNCFKIG